MAHAQKPDLVFQRHGRVHLYRWGCQFSRLLAAEVCASAVVMLDRPCPILCTTAGYPLHSPFSPLLLHPCVSVCHHIPFLLYYNRSPPTRTPRKPVLDLTDTTADINGLVRFAGRPNLVSARVPSHSVSTVPAGWTPFRDGRASNLSRVSACKVRRPS